MAALLRRSRLVWERSQLLGPTVQPLQDICAPYYAMSQSAPFSAAKSGTATRGRKKAQDQETKTAPSITGTTKDASEGQLGDGHSTPAKPKRGPTAWNQFLKEQFPELKKNSSHTRPVAEASKVIAQKWKGLSEEDKQPYLASAVAAKLANPVKSKAAKEKTLKKITGYRLFVKENFEAVKARNPTIRTHQVMTAMGHEWKVKAQEEKDAYVAKAEVYNRTLKLS